MRNEQKLSQLEFEIGSLIPFYLLLIIRQTAINSIIKIKNIQMMVILS